MREIKFNAVDEDTNEYIKFDDYIESDSCFCNNSSASRNELLADFLQHFFGFKLLQYTGLKDKNGVEIYEGDIISGINGSINGTGWEFGPYEIKYNNVGKHNVPTDWGGEKNYDSTHWFEVIGNIYENQELLIDNL